MNNSIVVLEMADNVPLGVKVFSAEQVKEAEAEFAARCRENEDGVTDEDVEASIENGHYEDGGYELYLIHEQG